MLPVSAIPEGVQAATVFSIPLCLLVALGFNEVGGLAELNLLCGREMTQLWRGEAAAIVDLESAVSCIGEKAYVYFGEHSFFGGSGAACDEVGGGTHRVSVLALEALQGWGQKNWLIANEVAVCNVTVMAMMASNRRLPRPRDASQTRSPRSTAAHGRNGSMYRPGDSRPGVLK